MPTCKRCNTWHAGIRSHVCPPPWEIKCDNETWENAQFIHAHFAEDGVVAHMEALEQNNGEPPCDGVYHIRRKGTEEVQVFKVKSEIVREYYATLDPAATEKAKEAAL